MRLLVTRPAANAAPLADKLAAQGHDIIISPVIEIYPTDTALPQLHEINQTAEINDLDGAANMADVPIGALALTSANGAHALAAKLPSTQAAREAWQALTAYAVGPQTAAALKAYGWQEIVEAAGDVESLAALIINRHKGASAVLHVAGRDRAGNLAAALQRADIICRLIMLYEAEAATALSPAAQAALADAQEPVDGVLLYSQRSAKMFLQLSADLAMAQKPIAYCLSPAIAALMQEAGFDTCTARHPDEAAMLALTAQRVS